MMVMHSLDFLFLVVLMTVAWTLCNKTRTRPWFPATLLPTLSKSAQWHSSVGHWPAPWVMDPSHWSPLCDGLRAGAEINRSPPCLAHRTINLPRLKVVRVTRTFYQGRGLLWLRLRAQGLKLISLAVIFPAHSLMLEKEEGGM